MAKLPKFKNLDEENKFWKTHDATEYFEDMEDKIEKIIDNRPKKIRTTIYLDLPEHDEIRKRAFYSGTSMAGFIREAVKEKLTSHLTGQ